MFLLWKWKLLAVVGRSGEVGWLLRGFWFGRVVLISICILDLQLMIDSAVSSNKWI